MAQQTQSQKAKPQTPTPFVGAAERVQAQIAQEAEQAEQAQAKPSRRGLSPRLQRLAQLDRILAGMDPDEAVSALQWLDGIYGTEARYYAEQPRGEASQTPAASDGR